MKLAHQLTKTSSAICRGKLPALSFNEAHAWHGASDPHDTE